MRRELFIHGSKRKSLESAGFSLIEMLVTLVITSIILTMLTAFFSAVVETKHDMGLRVEVQQGVRGVLEMITQELRQAGACLPQLGQFIALEGEDGGDFDTLTVRVGRTAADTLLCVKAGTTMAAATGATTVMVGPNEGSLFAEVDLAYVTPNGASGDFYPVVAHTANTITLGQGLGKAHPVGTGIYGVDVRAYTVTTLDDSNFVLTVSMDGGPPQPVANGVQRFNVEYLVCDEDPACAFEDEPADATAWKQVREVRLSTMVQARHLTKKGQSTTENGETIIKPRNLL